MSEGTGLFATQEEVDHLITLAKHAASMPVITMRSDRPTFAESAQAELQQAVNAVAHAHGLPKQRDGVDWNYGINSRTREIVR